MYCCSKCCESRDSEKRARFSSPASKRRPKGQASKVVSWAETRLCALALELFFLTYCSSNAQSLATMWDTFRYPPLSNNFTPPMESFSQYGPMTGLPNGCLHKVP